MTYTMFASLAIPENNLVSANQQSEFVDVTLEKKCEVGHIRPFESPHYQVSELQIWA